MKKLFLAMVLVLAAPGLRAQVAEGVIPLTVTDDGTVPLTVTPDGVVSGPIYYRGGALFNSIGNVIDKEQGRRYFKNELQYDAFMKGTRRTTAGYYLCSCGAAFVGGAVGYALGSLIYGRDRKTTLIGTGILLGVSVPFLAPGIPLWVSGKNTLQNLADDYNADIQGRSYNPSLTVGGTASGFGLALNF
jgi:hypothetical protein